MRCSGEFSGVEPQNQTLWMHLENSVSLSDLLGVTYRSWRPRLLLQPPHNRILLPNVHGSNLCFDQQY